MEIEPPRIPILSDSLTGSAKQRGRVLGASGVCVFWLALSATWTWLSGTKEATCDTSRIRPRGGPKAGWSGGRGGGRQVFAKNATSSQFAECLSRVVLYKVSESVVEDAAEEVVTNNKKWSPEVVPRHQKWSPEVVKVVTRSGHRSGHQKWSPQVSSVTRSGHHRSGWSPSEVVTRTSPHTYRYSST